MTVVEWLLCTLLFFFVGVCIITDCKKSVVPNKIVVIAFFSFIILDILCYCFFAKQFFRVFLLNLALITLVSFVFYAFHIWAAGDCKLMLACAFGIPGRLYSVWPIGKATSFLIYIIIFSTAFLFLMFESAIIRIKQRQYKIAFQKINLPKWLMSYFSMVFALLCFEGLFSLAFSKSSIDPVLSSAINFVIVLSLIQIRDKMSTTQLIFMLIGTSMSFFVMSMFGIIHTSFSVSAKNLVLVFTLLLLSAFAAEYNYRTVPVDELKAGQILSAATVILFAQSRVEGLPKSSTEDLRSRLSQENVDSIKKWSKTKSGSQYVVIVRKIPFVIFMGIGLFVFMAIGVLRIYDYL